uniref:Uncharacterized protein n=1 Tax=Chenopodium quinoa TaxID=63459 RepID=A0A803LLT8_CHEQI
MRGNKSRMNEMPELYQVVADYCFVKYCAFKDEELVKYEAPLMMTRDDTLTDETDKKDMKSPSTYTAELNQAWYGWMCLCDAKEKVMTAQLVEEMLNFLKRINHEKADQILEHGFDKINFKWKTLIYTLNCGVFAMIHMLCFSVDTFDSDLDLENRRKVYRAEICATLVLAEINTKRKHLVKKVSRFRVVRKLEKEKGVEDIICVYDFLKTHKEVMKNMSLKCHQLIEYLTINDDENFPNKSEVVGWFIDSIEIVREDCNTLLNEWKVSTNLITAWANQLNNNDQCKKTGLKMSWSYSSLDLTT